MLKSSLLATKFHPPALPPMWVQRPRLNQRLDEGRSVNRPLTLVSAPAGFGKTTCIRAWLETLPGVPVAWLSLEKADDDPRRFFSYLLAALRQIEVDLGVELAGVLHSGELPTADMIAATLGNGLLTLDGRLLLVLDDFHLIQSPLILNVVGQLLANPPPSLHLVLVTREDPPLPLARLRAHNRLTEIRARDLRFSVEESAAFLSEVMALSLAPEEVARLDEKTEGWVAGLQLVALALQAAARDGSAGDPGALIASLGGNHRFILGYLTEQVLDRQPAAIREFLLQTAILERLSGELCDAVTGRADGRALLGQLAAANLFLIPLDDAGRWYRYHHLFADLLRERQHLLPEGEVARLHRRAGRWYAARAAAQGANFELVDAAIRHALAGEAYAEAVALLERHVRSIIMQGHARAVSEWVALLPPAWQARSAQTALAFAWVHLLRGAYEEATPYMAQVEKALASAAPAAEKASLEAEWLVMRSLTLQMTQESAASERLARQALALAPAENAHAQSLAGFALASTLRTTGAVAAATDAYHFSIRQARTSGNSVAEMLSSVGLAAMAFERGGLQRAFAIAAPAIARLEQQGTLPPISSVLYGILGDVHYQWLRLEEAAAYSGRARRLSALGGYNSGRVFCRVLLCRLAQLEGDLEGAAAYLGTVADPVPGRLPAYVRQEWAAQQVRLYLAGGQPERARQALADEGLALAQPGRGGATLLEAISSGGPLTHAAGLLYNSGLRYLLYRARSGRARAALEEALAPAGALLSAARQGGYLLVQLETLLLRAQIYGALGTGWEAQAAADYAHALELAEPEGIAAVFVEQGAPVATALADLPALCREVVVPAAFVERLIARGRKVAPPAPAGNRPAPLVEPLTDREQEVLQLIARGLKYKEIATTLYISLNTVRFHVKGIYGKLGVNRRGEAVAQARRLGLL